MGWLIRIFGLFTVLLNIGCGGAGGFQTLSSEILSQTELQVPEDVTPGEIPPISNLPWQGLSICSDLNFLGLEWSSSLKVEHRDAFALALNVTGSFEGNWGWENLTGNFDGQGISMGLLQWNLGQGSLQPIWNDMIRRYPSQYLATMTLDQRNKIQTMLQAWNAQTLSSSFLIEEYGYNELDDPEIVARELGLNVEDLIEATSALTTENQASVNWAKANLLTGTQIRSDWASNLKALTVTAGYRSLQLQYSQKLHTKAIGYFKTYKMTQLRSYLVFFDIVVQNGSIPKSVHDEYMAWLASNQSATEYTKMKKMIDLRVAKANPQWQADVRARKMTLLNGTGTVHSYQRNLNSEYCTNIQSTLKL